MCIPMTRLSTGNCPTLPPSELYRLHKSIFEINNKLFKRFFIVMMNFYTYIYTIYRYSNNTNVSLDLVYSADDRIYINDFKTIINTSRLVVWCADHSYTLYSFWVMHEVKEREKRRKRKKFTETKTNDKRTDLLSACIFADDNEVYHLNIHTIFLLLLSLPVTSCSCEQSFSGLRCLKRWCQSSMSDKRVIKSEHFPHRTSPKHGIALSTAKLLWPSRIVSNYYFQNSLFCHWSLLIMKLNRFINTSRHICIQPYVHDCLTQE